MIPVPMLSADVRRRALVAALLVLVFLVGPERAQASPAPTCGGVPATIVGTDGDDIIDGTAGADVIVAGSGNDRVSGGGGADLICGGPGRDVLFGGGGDDFLNGGGGRDRVVGNVGSDRLIGGAGRDVLKAGAGIDRLAGGRGRDHCSVAEVVRGCEEGPGAPAPPGQSVRRVIHISVDGLRAVDVSMQRTPNLDALFSRGASTRNARTDPVMTRTLPNHTSQMTGRPVAGPDGHGVTYNEDLGRTVHDEAGTYVASVFDVVHDRGGRTGLWVGKPKFDALDRSWDGVHGAPDRTGVDDGRDKIDVYARTDPLGAVDLLLTELVGEPGLTYGFLHVRSPDEFGHRFGWGTAGYFEGVTEADTIVGAVVAAIETDPELAATTAIIVTSDHGGPTGGTNHGDETSAANYTIPFGVWAPGARPGADLYALNAGDRRDPGTGRPSLDGPQPIRGHDAANLALQLLGYDPIPGSVFGADRPLRIN